MKQKLKNILLNNWTLSLIICIPLILFLKPVKNKFHALISEHEILSIPGKIYYSDLNMDGNSERIEFYENKSGFGAVKIFDPDHRGQANARNSFYSKQVSAFFSNYDNNSTSEIYFTGVRNDSLFINIVDYSKLDDDDILSTVDEHFIYQLKPDTDIGWGIHSLHDLNNDSFKEILVFLSAGFALQPRIILAVDFRNDTIWQTPFSGTKKTLDFIQDTNNDGYPEIFGGTFAFRNYENIEVPFTDTCSWLMAFDHQLQYLFEPVLLSTKKSDAQVYPLKTGAGFNLLVAMESIYDINMPMRFYIYTTEGKLVKQLEIPLKETQDRRVRPCIIKTVKNEKQKNYVLDPQGNFYFLDEKMSFHYSHAIREIQNSFMIRERDLNHDGIPEFILKTGFAADYVILDHKLRNPAFFSLPSTSEGWPRVDFAERKGQNDKIFFQVNNELFFISYTQNPLWNYRFLIWAAIFGAVYGLLWLLQFIQKERIKTQIETRQQIKELQFKVITSQLNPHFTFNALNTISSSVYDPEKPELYDRFTTFSRLIRSILSDSDKITRSLHDELNFTRDFLKIQKLRFKEAFEYYFEIDEQVDQKIPVPKLIIQIFAENAIKHAFPSVFGEDKLIIRVIKVNKNIKIEIEDNGIGRERAKIKKHTHKNTGKGLQLMSEYISLLNKQNHQKIKISIVDLNENKSGTLVRVSIPAHFKYKLK